MALIYQMMPVVLVSQPVILNPLAGFQGLVNEEVMCVGRVNYDPPVRPSLLIWATAQESHLRYTCEVCWALSPGKEWFYKFYF